MLNVVLMAEKCRRLSCLESGEEREFASVYIYEYSMHPCVRQSLYGLWLAAGGRKAFALAGMTITHNQDSSNYLPYKI